MESELHLLLYSLNACSGQGWDGPKSGDRNSVQASGMARQGSSTKAITGCLLGVYCMKLESEANPAIWTRSVGAQPASSSLGQTLTLKKPLAMTCSEEPQCRLG